MHDDNIKMAYDLYYNKDINSLRKLSKKINEPTINFLLGRLLGKRNETQDEAIDILLELNGTNKSYAGILEAGRILIKQKKLVEARKLLKKIINTNLGYAALFEIGRIRELEGNNKGAKGCYYQSLEKKKDAYTFYQLGKLLVVEGNFIKAKRMFENALKIKPNDYYSKFELSIVLIELEEYDKAKNILLKLLNEKNDPFVEVKLGRIEVIKGNLNEAEKLFRSALDKNSNAPYALHELGLVLFSKRQFEESKHYFEKVLELKKVFASQYYLAKICRITGDIKRAKELLENLELEYDDAYGVYKELGRVNFQLGDFEKSKRYFERSLEYCKLDTTIIELAQVERFLGNFDSAEELLKECTNKTYKYAALFELGMICIGRGDMEKAINTLEESIKENDKDYVVLRTLTRCYVSANKLKLARELIEKYPKIKENINVEILIYLYSQLGIEYDEINFNNLTYQEKQILDYSEKAAISYMQKMQKTDFYEDAMYTDLDCEKVFEEVKEKISEKNKLYKLSFGNTYLVKLDSGMELKVSTLPNDDILKIFPVYNSDGQYIDKDEYKEVLKEI